jgi:hypothetical protein
VSRKSGSIVLLVLLLVSLLLGLADACGWLGQRRMLHPDVLQVTYSPVDAVTGERLENTRVNCFMRGNNEACTLLRGGDPSLVTVNLGIMRVETHGRWSVIDSQIQDADALEISLMFIHPSHERHVLSYRLGELAALAGAVQKVALPPAPSAELPASE